MKQGEGSMPGSQRHIIRVLCCITTVSCSVCLLLTTTILVVVLCQKAGHLAAQNFYIDDFHQHLMELLQARKTTVAHLQLAAWQNNSEKMMWNSDGILQNIEYQAGDLMIKTSGFYFVYCHLHFKRNCSGEHLDLTIGLRVNGEVKHETLHTCNLESSSEKGYMSQFLGVVFSLRTNDTVSVFTNWADFVDKNTMIRSNVFGIFTLH